jgi:hypothetical protein
MQKVENGGDLTAGHRSQVYIMTDALDAAPVTTNNGRIGQDMNRTRFESARVRPLPDLVRAARTQPPTRGLIFELVWRAMFWKRRAERYRQQVEIERQAHRDLLSDSD